MPQPLSNFGAIQTVSFTPHAARERPEHAIRIAKLIAMTPYVEAAIVRALAHMLGSNPLPAAAMFMSLRSGGAQSAAIEGVAEAVLSPDNAEMFIAVQDVITGAAETRNRFAHWIWGSSPELPDAILLQNPKARRDYNFALVDGWREIRTTGETDKLEAVATDLTQIYAYTLPDIDEATERLRRAHHIAEAFATLVNDSLPKPTLARIYVQLGAQPEVASALARRQKNQPKTP